MKFSGACTQRTSPVTQTSPLAVSQWSGGSRIYEVTPWFGGSYRLRMDAKGGPEIPLSRAQARELRKILKW